MESGDLETAPLVNGTASLGNGTNSTLPTQKLHGRICHTVFGKEICVGSKTLQTEDSK